MIERVGQSQQHQMLAVDTEGGPLQNFAKFPCAPQASLLWQAKAGYVPVGHTARKKVPAASGGKPFAPFLPPPAENLTTAAGGHPRPEAVGALAPNYARLIGAFHGVVLLKRL